MVYPVKLITGQLYNKWERLVQGNPTASGYGEYISAIMNLVPAYRVFSEIMTV